MPILIAALVLGLAQPSAPAQLLHQTKTLNLPREIAPGDTSCGGEVSKEDGIRFLHVHRSYTQCNWPFTVDELAIGCVGAQGVGAAVAVTTDGKTYALNGTARMRLKLEPIDAIWAENPAIPGTKIIIDPWISVALSLCD